MMDNVIEFRPRQVPTASEVQDTARYGRKHSGYEHWDIDEVRYLLGEIFEWCQWCDDSDGSVLALMGVDIALFNLQHVDTREADERARCVLHNMRHMTDFVLSLDELAPTRAAALRRILSIAQDELGIPSRGPSEDLAGLI